VLLAALGEVSLPSMVASLINAGMAGADTAYVLRQGTLMCVMALLLVGIGLTGNILATRASIHYAADLRRDCYRKIQTYSFGDLDRIRTGSLVTRLTNDITQIRMFVMQMLRMGVRGPAQLLGAMILAFRINARLALVFLVVTPTLGIVIGLIIRAAMPRFRTMQERIDALNTRLQECMANIRVIKSFVREDFETGRFERSSDDLRGAALTANRTMLLQRPAMTVIMNLTTIAFVWFGGRLIIGGQMSVGDLTAFVTYITQILTSLMMLSNILLTSSRAVVSSRRIREVLDLEPELDDEGASGFSVADGSIEFRNVSYRYYKNNPNTVLEDISFTIRPGQTVGIVGSTGSGKTTLVHMIPRLMDPDEGEVLVGGRNVKTYKLRELRNSVSMVLQNNLLFSGSVAENLRWGKEDASEEELREKASYAQADAFITAMPDSYETELGQGGVNLSGGQKQRMCIARALLKSPKILILDDSTSAVDTATEARIYQHFDRDLKGMTKLIIAQRVSSIMHADLILVLDAGKLVGSGAHEELLESNTTYQEIYWSQMKREEKPA